MPDLALDEKLRMLLSKLNEACAEARDLEKEIRAQMLDAARRNQTPRSPGGRRRTSRRTSGRSLE